MVLVLQWGIFAGRPSPRNAFLLAASYFFYGWWDWRFLGLIVFSSTVDYVAGRVMAKDGDGQRGLLRVMALVTSLVVNLGLLATLKYVTDHRAAANDSPLLKR